ncbi:hypothetical protein chiPu_0004585 [Chiloscyllium punctatum]|uniref:Uncharacterized protein n=1 Tax=Chiloscyllium punctatum TaxID=137246 RepID=A0A401S744_CHIPU|nr:hypothetical protein [Chiloscyllium punctatum]
MQVVVPHDLLDLNIQALFLGLQEAKNSVSGDLQATMADLEAHMHANFAGIHTTEQLNMAKLQVADQSGTADNQASMFADLHNALQDGMADQLTALKVGLTEIQNALEIDLSSIWGAIYVGLKQLDTNLQQMHTTILRNLSQISEDISSVVSLVTDEVLEQACPSIQSMKTTNLAYSGMEYNQSQGANSAASDNIYPTLLNPYFISEDVIAADPSTSTATISTIPRECLCEPFKYLFMKASSEEVIQERFRLDDYDEEDNLTENLRGEDSESTISTADNLLYYAGILEK